MAFNKDKYKSLVHYICYRSKEDKLGSTKLNKILWYSEAINFLITGESITGETFKKEQFGPIPFHILPIIADLEKSGVIACSTVDHHGYPKKNYHCPNSPAQLPLTDDEKIIVDRVADIICERHTAVSISDFSHDDIWDIAENGEQIPLYSFLVSKAEDPTQDVFEWARSIPINEYE